MSVSLTRDCSLDTRWELFIYLWFQGDDESLIDSQTIITAQILDNNTQRLTIENIRLAGRGRALIEWFRGQGQLGQGGITRRKLSIRPVSGASDAAMAVWAMSEGLSEAGAKLLFQWVRPSERKRGKKSELIPVAGSSARHGPTYLSRNVELIYFQNSDQKVATSLHGGELTEKVQNEPESAE